MEKKLKEVILSDLYRYVGKKNLKNFWLQYTLNPSFKYSVIYRKANYYSGKKILSLFYRLRLFFLSKRFGYQIQYSTKIGKGLYIGHRGTVIINGKANIGNNVNIATGVTIGQENRGKRKGVPSIGDNCWIGTNSVIVGKIKVGNNVLIAPNSFINVDVPDNSVVLGNPAVIIPEKLEATEGYIQNEYTEV